ncbi:MAG: NAD-dependent epimerase/dehydratase family protein, partial [Actinobacteria bacterium]|nr:NAD-dependent epimerase/dehydratase family protein [Actinomycetota bacterium]
MLVVLTGAEGRIGSGFRDEYLSSSSPEYDLRLAVHPADFADERFPQVVRFDLAELDSVRAAFRDADAVIHLAGNADQN